MITFLEKVKAKINEKLIPEQLQLAQVILKSHTI